MCFLYLSLRAKRECNNVARVCTSSIGATWKNSILKPNRSISATGTIYVAHKKTYGSDFTLYSFESCKDDKVCRLSFPRETLFASIVRKGAVLPPPPITSWSCPFYYGCHPQPTWSPQCGGLVPSPFIKAVLFLPPSLRLCHPQLSCSSHHGDLVPCPFTTAVILRYLVLPTTAVLFRLTLPRMLSLDILSSPPTWLSCSYPFTVAVILRYLASPRLVYPAHFTTAVYPQQPCYPHPDLLFLPPSPQLSSSAFMFLLIRAVMLSIQDLSD